MAFSSTYPSSPPPEGRQQRTPRYPGEDTTPTSKREIWGWYAYGIAAEVFAVCAVGALRHFCPKLPFLTLVVSNRLVSTTHLGAARSRTWRPAVEPPSLRRVRLPSKVPGEWDGTSSVSARWR